MNFLGDHGIYALANVLFISGLPFYLPWLFFSQRMQPDTYAIITTIWGVLNIPVAIIEAFDRVQQHNWLLAIIDIAWGIFIVYLIYQAWKRWKDKKKVAQAIGAKSRALRDKLVRNVRETLPEGAR